VPDVGVGVGLGGAAGVGVGVGVGVGSSEGTASKGAGVKSSDWITTGFLSITTEKIEENPRLSAEKTL
jgi:hypothetical protein